MRSAGVAAVLDRTQPLVITNEDGVAWCPWPYFKRSEKGVIAASIWELDLHEECHRLGFPDYFVYKDRENLRHEIRLLGKDSPGEYIYSFDSRLIGDDGLEDLARDMVWWVKQMHVVHRIQQGA